MGMMLLEANLLTAKRIFEQQRTRVILADYLEPVILCRLFDAVISRYPVLRGHVFGVMGELFEFVALSWAEPGRMGHFLDGFRN
jgi:hypothetical protein